MSKNYVTRWQVFQELETKTTLLGTIIFNNTILWLTHRNDENYLGKKKPTEINSMV
jgi:hypothetical protein